MGMLPIQLVGIACTYGLMMLAGVADGDSDAPTHPIIDALGDPVAVLGAFMVAIVLAPIVEETAFRGLLYRQLRSLSAFGRGALSVTISAVVTGLLFAAIHPQGLLAIPALMSIAIAVALAREWRGSLIAPMIMHGMNNALAVTALLIIIKG
jgi:membrane protease YdiL (CAAX protease family)